MFFNLKTFNAKKVYVFAFLLTHSIIIQAQEAETAAPASESGGHMQEAAGSGSGQQRGFFFPRWPERHEVRRERIPPPPPGPYMSSALTGDSIEEPSFSQRNRHEMMFESNSASVETFSPDAPWPSNFDSPHRWKPEDGYNYVKPQAEQQPYSVRPPYYNYAYPARNWPAVNSAPGPDRGYRQ
jgi:hypothetical protein